MNPRAFFVQLEARIARLEKALAEQKAQQAPKPVEPEVKRGPGRPPKVPQ